MQLRLPTALAGLLALLACTPACGSGERPAARRVILIVLDAARGDRFSYAGYEPETTPNMDRLAAGGLAFRRHFANGVATRNSMPTLMYSRTFAKPVFPVHLGTPFYRPEDLFRQMDDAAISMPAAFEHAGFHTVGISAHQWFHVESEYAQQFEEFHDLPRELGYEPERATPRAEEVVDYALDYLERFPDDQDLFLYLHLMDSHFPHFLDEDAAELFGADEYEAERFNDAGYPIDLARPLEGRDRDYMDALYDGSLRYLDRHLGRLFDHLRADGRLDSTLIAITADHGEELLHQPGRFAHGSWWDPVARIPMILSYPDRVDPGVVDALTENIDVLPTLLELADVSLPDGKEIDGRSLLAGHDDGSRAAVHAWCGLRTERFKLMTNLRKLLAGEPWGGAVLYDLEADPLELVDVSAQREDVVRGLLEEAAALLQPRFDRYASVLVDEQPSWVFALEPLYAELDGAPVVALDRQAQWRRAGGDTPGWGRCGVRLRSFLLAAPGAAPLDVELEVPSGPYELSLAVNGTCRVATADGEGWHDVVGPEFDPSRTLDSLDARSVGTYVAEERRLALRLAPGADGRPVSIAAFHLRPLDVEPPNEEAAERASALQQLGY